MKRYGNLWDKIVTKENLILAFEKARRHKRWQKKVKIEINGEKKVVFTNSTVLKDQLERYKEHLPFITTIIKPKKYYTFS